MNSRVLTQRRGEFNIIPLRLRVSASWPNPELTTVSMQFPEGKILVFCKAPEPGRVKTRLQSVLSPEQCAQLHQRLAEDTLQIAVNSRIAAVELWCADDPQHPFFKQCETRYKITLHQQHGEDLGTRMLHALQTTLPASAFAIIIGTDCPGLHTYHLRAAAEFLTDKPAAPRIIIGPATDGGYVLIGCNRVIAEIFTDINWGSNEVLKQTHERLHDMSIIYNELEPLADIDRPEDLKYLSVSMGVEFL